LSIQLILGGSFQGKLAFALQLTGLSPDCVADGSSPNNWLEKPILNGIHRGIHQMCLEGGDSYAVVENLLDKNPHAVILCDEIGCGIVPMEPKEREYRETVGRICCMLAKQARRVIRVQCGIPQVIQGDPL
jgi:adenosylcobinamide kinase/adenosylcobinamide-phosphate guanylyltransferase